MKVIIDEFCRTCFLLPFNLLENDIKRAFWFRHRYQVIELGGVEFYLYLRRFSNYFILIKGIWRNGEFTVEEAYKLYRDLVIEQNLAKIDLLSLLKSFYELNGSEVNFAGSKAKFFHNHKGIGIPKIPSNLTWMEENFHIWSQFVISTERHLMENEQIKCCTPILSITKGNYVDFVDVLLYYEINPTLYNNYLKK